MSLLPAAEVGPVRTHGDFEAFVSLPYRLYRGDPAWAPPLRRDARSVLTPSKNPFFEHACAQLLLARRGARVVGRLAAIDDRLHGQVHGDGAGFFGFFECEDDQAAAAALFASASDWLRGRGLTCVRGPVSPSLNDEAGLLVDGFDTLAVLMMPHNPAYYARLVEAAGFGKLRDLLAYQSTHDQLPARLVQATELVVRRHGVTLRSIDLTRFDSEVGRIKSLFNASWQANWGFVPLTDREIDHLARRLRPLVVPELVVFAERSGDVIGFAAALPDFNVALRANPSGRLFPGILKVLWRARKLTRLRVLLLGTLPAWQGKGVDALLYRRIWEAGCARGFRWAEAGWVLEDNHAMRNALVHMGFEAYKTYRLYERPL